MKTFRGALKYRLAFGLLLLWVFLSGCPVTAPRVYIPLGYAAMGLGIAILVSPSCTAALWGLVLGGIIGAAVYNNSLKPDLVERFELPTPQEGWR